MKRLLLRKNELTILELPYATKEDLDNFRSKLHQGFPCILMNYHVEIKKVYGVITIKLSEREFTLKEVNDFIRIFKKLYSRVKKSSDTFEIKEKFEGLRKRIVPFNKGIALIKPYQVLKELKGENIIYINESKIESFEIHTHREKTWQCSAVR